MPEVLAWRRRQLRAAGFRSALASRVARDAAYDLHALIELVERLLRSAEQRLRDGGVVMLQLHRQVFAVERADLAAFAAGLGELVRRPLPAAA